MQGTWKFFSLFNIPVKIHWSFGLIFIWIFLVGYINSFQWDKILWLGLIFLVLFTCVIMHEFGHALSAKWYGVRTRDIILSPIGGLARLEKVPSNPIHEFFIALAGPMVNFVIALILFLCIYFFAPKSYLHAAFFSSLEIGT
ncbi:MAG: M50 family metallopeptidase, partial [Bacteroidota bacterium]